MREMGAMLAPGWVVVILCKWVETAVTGRVILVARSAHRMISLWKTPPPSGFAHLVSASSLVERRQGKYLCNKMFDLYQWNAVAALEPD